MRHASPPTAKSPLTSHPVSTAHPAPEQDQWLDDRATTSPTPMSEGDAVKHSRPHKPKRRQGDDLGTTRNNDFYVPTMITWLWYRYPKCPCDKSLHPTTLASATSVDLLHTCSNPSNSSPTDCLKGPQRIPEIRQSSPQRSHRSPNP